MFGDIWGCLGMFGLAKSLITCCWQGIGYVWAGGGWGTGRLMSTFRVGSKTGQHEALTCLMSTVVNLVQPHMVP